MLSFVQQAKQHIKFTHKTRIKKRVSEILAKDLDFIDRDYRMHKALDTYVINDFRKAYAKTIDNIVLESDLDLWHFEPNILDRNELNGRLTEDELADLNKVYIHANFCGMNISIDFYGEHDTQLYLDLLTKLGLEVKKETVWNEKQTVDNLHYLKHVSWLVTGEELVEFAEQYENDALEAARLVKGFTG